MRATLLLLFMGVQAVYMKTYLIETKSEAVEENMPLPVLGVFEGDDGRLNVGKGVVGDDYEGGEDDMGNEYEAGNDYAGGDEDMGYEYGADYSDDYEEEAGQDYAAGGWGQTTTTTTTTTTPVWISTTTTTTTTTPGWSSTLAACILSPWGEWTKEQPCGQTRQRRSRTCKRGNLFCSEHECAGKLVEEQDITLEPCCSWSDWKPWTKPSDPCITSQVTRERTCISSIQGYNCDNQCHGNSREEKTVQGSNCCVWTAWVDGACSVTCATGTQTRTRACKHNGVDCPTNQCQGEASSSSQCTLQPCPAPAPAPAPAWG